MFIQYISVEPWQYGLCYDFNLYCLSTPPAYVLYKKAGQTLSAEKKHPLLHIRRENNEELKRNSHNFLAASLEDCLKNGNPQRINSLLIFTMNQMLSEPRGGNLRICFDAAARILCAFLQEESGVNALRQVCSPGKTTALHSVSVMAFTLGLCKFRGHPQQEMEHLALASLMHDIGKSRMPINLLEAPRILNGNEKKLLQRHVAVGCAILQNNCETMRRISLTVAEHHEKLDGSGYPLGTTTISRGGQIMAIVDIYDALTNDRPYRQPLSPLAALDLIGSEVQAGRLNEDVYRSLVLSIRSDTFR